MKRLKFFLILPIISIILLLSSYEAFSKVYFDQNNNKLFDGKDFPVLDISIFLDKYKFDNNNKEWTAYDLYGGPVFNNLICSITNNEMSISSSNLIRTIINLGQNSSNIKYIDIIEKINNKEKWLKFITIDQEFIVLIPKQKYPNIKTIDDLEKIGINKKILIELKNIENSKDGSFYKDSEITQQNRINSLGEQTPELKTAGLIKHETLFSLFLETTESKKISKRVFLEGHGYFQKEKLQSKSQGPVKINKPKNALETGSAIAQLRPYQYVKMLEKLSKINCSFLYVNSCYYGGFNAVSCQNYGFYEQKNIFKKFENIDKNIKYIICVESTPDISVSAQNISTSIFFLQINKFFIEQKDKLIEYLKLNIYEPNKNINPENISETEILTGEYVRKKIVNKNTGKIEYSDQKISLIEQKPWIAESKEFCAILDYARFLTSTSLSSVRFPGRPFFRFSVNKDRKIDEDLEVKTLKIDYPFLLNHEVKNGKSSNIKIQKEQPVRLSSILLYPSIINLKFEFIDIAPKFVSMIPGRAQHYLKGIIIGEYISSFKDKNSASIANELATKFTLGTRNAKKSYFVENINFLESKTYKPSINFIENFFINIALSENNTNYEYIYKDTSLKTTEKKYFHNFEKNEYDNTGKFIKKVRINEVIGKNKVMQLIKKWTLETTPAKEAIFEATAGVENIYSFRNKINTIFDNKLFNKNQLGKFNKAI